MSSKLTSEKPILLLRVKNVPLKQMLPEVAKLIRLSVKDVTFIVLTKIHESCIFCNYIPFWDNYWIWVKMQQFCENSVWQKASRTQSVCRFSFIAFVKTFADTLPLSCLLAVCTKLETFKLYEVVFEVSFGEEWCTKCY